jgi:hypothetical protein
MMMYEVGRPGRGVGRKVVVVPLILFQSILLDWERVEPAIGLGMVMLAKLYI